MKLKLRFGIAMGGAISFAAGVAQLSACATAGDGDTIVDAGADIVFHPRPTGSSDGSAADASTCTADPCVLRIAAGGAHTCAVIQDGTVRCWGDNYAGELGASDGGLADGGTPAFNQTPIVVSGITGAVGIAAGGPFSSGSYDGDMTCAFSTTGAPQCWGSNEYDLLGNGAANDTIAHPIPSPVATLSAASIISLGQTVGCAITSGALACWGENNYQQLAQPLDGGFGSSTPVTISLPDGKKALQSASGYGHTCAVLDDNTVACWGYGYYGQCGTIGAPPYYDQSTPAIVAGLANITEVAAGSYHSCALDKTGAVQCWGYNYEGMLGNGPGDGGGFQNPTPVSVLLPTGRKAAQIVAGQYSTCALLDDGTVACWGFNTYGQMGFAPDGGAGVSSTPVIVAGVSGATQLAMGAGSEHVCARLATGGVKCWGANTSGQLGASSGDAGPGLASSPTPLDVVF
jgi:alpha-tubulin suppressor-like RCC1 family protein